MTARARRRQGWCARSLLDEFRRIDTALRQHIDGIPVFLPAADELAQVRWPRV